MHWLQLASDFRRMKNFTCNRCKGRGWQVHHKSYKNLGRESADELELLCDVCHEEEHAPRGDALDREIERKLREL